MSEFQPDVLSDLQLEKGRKTYRAGTHRMSSPIDTLDWLSPKLSELGITRIADITGLDRIGVPVAMVVRPNSRSLAVSQGKGLSLASARVSGIMESVETFHAERITRPLKLTDRSTLRKAVRVANTDAMAKSGNNTFNDTVRTLWIEGVDLLSGESTWVPYEAVHTDFTVPGPSGSGYFPADTNGLAAGNSNVEAIAHALYEVVERDAMALWHRGDDADREVVNLREMDDQEVVSLIDKLAAADVDVRVWNATSDIGIPCYHCLVMGKDRHLADPEFGSGCHPDGKVALSRAITEAIQARATFIAGSRDDLGTLSYSSEQRTRRFEACRNLMNNSAVRTRFESSESNVFDTIIDDLHWSLGQLTTCGIKEVIWIDLSLEEFAIPVARVVIPGLEGACDTMSGQYAAGGRSRQASGS